MTATDLVTSKPTRQLCTAPLGLDAGEKLTHSGNSNITMRNFVHTKAGPVPRVPKLNKVPLHNSLNHTHHNPQLYSTKSPVKKYIKILEFTLNKKSIS